MKNLTWQNPEQLFVAQELINKVKSKCCGIKVHLGHPADKQLYRKINKEKYLKKQEQLKIKFNNSNFFGRFDTETVDVVTYLK